LRIFSTPQKSTTFGELTPCLIEINDSVTLGFAQEMCGCLMKKVDDCTSSVRILVVDDYEPFRRFICSTMEQRLGLQVIGEASDGLEAVQKSQELQPDLIVLDLGLPKLSGIEAAGQIHKLSPESKILIVSQECSTDVAQEAFSAGVLGYVVKAHAGNELLTAVEAVRQGRRFISSGLSGPPFTKDVQGPDGFDHAEGGPSVAPGNLQTARIHEVQFYSDDESFLVGFSRFIEAALLAGNAVIVAVTEVHQSGLLEKLYEGGVNLSAAIDQERYLTLDIAETLSTFMVNDLPDPVRFHKVTSDLVALAAKASKGKPPKIAVCGECAPTLWAQGNADAAIQLEHLWDEIAKTHDMDVLCGYVLTNFQHEREAHVRERICAEHSAVWFGCKLQQ
jgi:CheY-like chemotaxis protein